MINLTEILDSNSESKSESIDIDSIGYQEQLMRLHAQRYGSDTNDRKWLAKWTAWTVSIWLSIVLFIIITNNILSINLSDSTLIALLGTTTINVLGLSFIVLRGHFNSGN
jgi:hypothetical protein